jgi:hypothetical protein
MKTLQSLSIPILVLLAITLACGSGGTPVALQPSSSPMVVLGSSPVPTDTLTPLPSLTAMPDYSGPCANVLYPFIPGSQWVYQKLMVSADGTATPTPDPLTSKFGFSVVEVNGSQAILNAVDLGTGTTTRTTANCQEGAITDFPLMTLGSLFGNYLVGDIQTTYVSGLFAPSRSSLDASGWNMQWQGEYVATGTVSISAEGEQTTVTLSDSPVHMTWQNAGQETVTVPAGTFENAYKVTRTSEVDASINVEGLAGRGTLIIKTVHWFAPFVGLLKTEVVSAHLTTLGVSFPIEATGSSVELVEFQPGP